MSLAFACQRQVDDQTPNVRPDDAEELCSSRCDRDLECEPGSYPSHDECVENCVQSPDWVNDCEATLRVELQCINALSCAEYTDPTTSQCLDEIEAYSSCVAQEDDG